jgi:hypothetical protein
MTQFMNNTLTDIRRGRESWRVFVAFCTPAFITIVALTLQRLG